MATQPIIVQGDAFRLPLLDGSVDAIVTDPPYNLSFMGRKWDTVGGPQAFQAWCEQWATDALRVLRPGGWLLAFGGTRTWHRLACGIEDAGFEMRDTIAEFGPLAWLYGSGFPKSRDVSKDIDKMAGMQREQIGPNPWGERRHANPQRPGDSPALIPNRHGTGAYGEHPGLTAPATPEVERWQGWGTALKPSWEPVLVARKPLAGNVAQNVLEHGTGALNIDATRIEGTWERLTPTQNNIRGGNFVRGQTGGDACGPQTAHPSGRWPSNVALIHSPGCQPTGTRKIRSGNTLNASDSGGYTGNDVGRGVVGPHYADADGMEEVTAWTCEEDCPVALLDQQSGDVRASGHRNRSEQAGEPTTAAMGYMKSFAVPGVNTYADQGGASRFFYTAKAGPNERVTIDGEGHPTVKPLALMRWLVRLVTPPGGIVLDMFAGSGTTGEAAMLEGFRSILIDKDPANLPSIRVRTHPYVRRTRVVTNGQTGPEQGSLL